MWELKQSDILKMKCQEKNDKNEELENDVTYVDVTHVMTGIKIEIFTVQTVFKRKE